MKKYIYIVFSVLGILTVASCGRDVKSNNWGKAVYYKDFLFKKCPSDTLTRTLVISFNEESMKMPRENSDLLLSLYKVLDNGSTLKVNSEEAVLLINDEPAENNVFAIAPVEAEQKIKVGVVLSNAFLENVQEGIVSYMFKVEKNPGYDRLNNLDISGNATPLLDPFNDEAMQMRVYVEIIPNSLKLGVIWGGLILLALFVLWYFVSRLFIWRRTPFTYVDIDYGITSTRVKMGGAYEFVLTNDRKIKDSFFEKIFKGRRKYEYNEFWTSKLVIRKASYGQHLMISTRGDYDLPDEAIRREEFKIRNEAGQSATLSTN